MKRELLNIKLLLFSLIIIISTQVLHAQNAHEHRREADKKYTQGSYPEAEEKYRKSLASDPKMNAYFNLGNSLFQQQRYEEAREQYDKAIARTNDPMIQSKAYHNKGNSFFNEQKLPESINAYKQALRLNPEDKDALQNLYIAKQFLRQQQKEEQQDQQQNQNQDQQQEEQEKQDQQEQEDQENQQNDQQNKEQQQNMENDSISIDSLAQRMITREELMKLLKAVEEEDKEIQQKLRRGSEKKKKSDKDW